MKPAQVREFISSLGKAYEKYAKKFKIRGAQLIMFNEAQLQKFVPIKLHRHRILMEIARHSPNRADARIFDHNHEVLHWDSSRVRQWCRSNTVLKLYADKFMNHGVDGMLLLELDAQDLKTIGVKKMHQKRVLEIIEQFGKDQFGSDDDIKEPEDKSMNGDSKPKKERGRRQSVANDHMLNGMNGVIPGSNQNNDAIIYTMGQLLLELGEMFKVGKVQELTTKLQQQLDELKSNSNHPQMTDRGSMVDLLVNMDDIEEVDDDEQENQSPSAKKAMMLKMGDRVDSSPTGVDTAWINTQTGKSGHRRRDSLPFINTNQLEDDEEEDISDIE